MKKFISVILCGALLLGLSACSQNREPATTTAKTTTTKAPTTTTTAAPTMSQRTPETLGSMQMGGLYYKPKQSSVIYICDTAEKTTSETVMLQCLQGLVSRNESASIYLRADEDDEFWRSYLSEEYGIVFKATDTATLLSKYIEQVKSIVIYDANKQYQYSIAQTIAAQSDGLAVSKELYNTYISIFESKVSDGSISLSRISRKWKNAAGAIRWAGKNLIDGASTHYIGVTDGASGINDYLYAAKALNLYVDKGSKAQKKAFKRILASEHFTKPAVLMTAGVDFTKSASKVGLCSQNFGNLRNVTFFASFPQNNDLNTQPASVDRNAQDGITYIALCLNSDTVCASASQMNNLLNNTARGSVAASVSISPALAEIAAPILNWTYINRGVSTVFVSTDTGYSKIDVNSFSKDALSEWMLTNNHFLGMSELGLVAVNSKLNDDTALLLSESLNADGFICRRIKKSFVANGVPFIKSKAVRDLSAITPEDCILPEAEDGKAQFLCLNIDINALDETVFDKLNGLIINYQQANPDKVEFLQVDDLAATMVAYDIAQQTTTETTTEPTSGKQQ